LAAKVSAKRENGLFGYTPMTFGENRVVKHNICTFDSPTFPAQVLQSAPEIKGHLIWLENSVLFNQIILGIAIHHQDMTLI
jgi:hypothetical protein